MKWGMHLGGVQGLIPEKEGEGRLGGWELKDCESSEGASGRLLELALKHGEDKQNLKRGGAAGRSCPGSAG